MIGAWGDIIRTGGIVPSSRYLSSSKWTGKVQNQLPPRTTLTFSFQKGECLYNPAHAIANVTGYDWAKVKYSNHPNATEYALFKHGPLATTIYVNPQKFFQLEEG